MSDSSYPMETLNESACWRLLRTTTLGRLAVSTSAGVDIFPVNFVVDQAGVVFRTAHGTKLTAALNGERVAFEADGLDDDLHEWWSVVIHGVAAEMTSQDQMLDALTLPLTPFQGAGKARFVRVSAESVTGRRFAEVDPKRWANPTMHARRAPNE